MTNFIYNITDLIFSNSRIFDKFRNFVHSNFKDEKKIISKNFDKNKLTLDFGCGAGQLSGLFNSNKYYGADTDVKYVRFCNSNHKGKFLVIKNSPPYNFKPKYFEQILISSVIHHIDNKNLSMIAKEIKRILKDNGELMIVDHFTKKNQKNLICKMLINLDRGKYFRDLDQVKDLFSKYFKVKNVKLFKNSVYDDYMIIFSKK